MTTTTAATIIPINAPVDNPPFPNPSTSVELFPSPVTSASECDPSLVSIRTDTLNFAPFFTRSSSLIVAITDSSESQVCATSSSGYSLLVMSSAFLEDFGYKLTIKNNFPHLNNDFPFSSTSIPVLSLFPLAVMLCISGVNSKYFSSFKVPVILQLSLSADIHLFLLIDPPVEDPSVPASLNEELSASSCEGKSPSFPQTIFLGVNYDASVP